MMRVSNLTITEEDLLRYVDDELDISRHNEVTEYIKQHSEVASRIAHDIKLGANLNHIFNALNVVPLPPKNKLNQSLVYLNMKKISSVAAIIVISLIGATLGWWFKPVTTVTTAPTFMDDAITAHKTYIVELAHPVEVTAQDRGYLVAWLSNRLDEKVSLPDLRIAGFTLLGGRLLPGVGTPAAQLMYEKVNGTRITLYLRPDHSENLEFNFSDMATGNAFYWNDGNLGYAITGAISQQQLLEIGQLLQLQISTKYDKI